MDRNQIIKEFISNGIVVIPNYATVDLCNSLIQEMDEIKGKYSKKIISQKSENTAGDFRFFKLENLSKNANSFKNDPFIINIINQYCKTKFSSLFVQRSKKYRSKTYQLIYLYQRHLREQRFLIPYLV